MSNPFFEGSRFPLELKEADAFIEEVSETLSEVEVIKAYFTREGGNWNRLVAHGQTPFYIWRGVLQRLGPAKFRSLCDKLLSDFPQLKGVIDPILTFGNAANDGPKPAHLLDPSPEKTKLNFLNHVADHVEASQSLTFFVSPYAADDVERVGDPRLLAVQLFQQSLHHLQKQMDQPDGAALSGEILSNLLVATSSSLAMASTPDKIWGRLCDLADVVGAGAGASSRFCRQLASFAVQWQSCFGLKRRIESNWRGLLLMTCEIGHGLENELFKAGVQFIVVNVQASGECTCWRQTGHDPKGVPIFEDAQIQAFAPSRKRSERDKEAEEIQTVVVVKLMGCAQLRTRRPLLGMQEMVQGHKTSTLPDLLANQLQKSAFVMLGGGLLDPYVALTFETHFRPLLEQGSVRRHLVLHPSPRSDDVLRETESMINSLDPTWIDRTYGLDLLVADLPEMVARMADGIADIEQNRAAA